MFAGESGTLFVRDGVGLAARGEALRINLAEGTQSVDAIASILGAIPTDDPIERSGTGPVAIGALPFWPGDAGYRTVPKVVVAKSSDGRAWMTQVFPSGSEPTEDIDLVGQRSTDPYASPEFVQPLDTR